MRAVVLGFCLVLVLGETVHIVGLACLSESMVRTKFENTKNLRVIKTHALEMLGKILIKIQCVWQSRQ